jgi:hypothetical protein
VLNSDSITNDDVDGNEESGGMTGDVLANSFKFIIEEDKVVTMSQFGYPKEYVIRCLNENEANYCTAGYYLLQVDQNY